MNQKPRPSARPLYAWEIQEARRVFAHQLNYERVRVHEFSTWPNAINRLGMRLKGMSPKTVDNAITLGYHCYFPVKLPEELPTAGQPEHAHICWLIHELTHAWQYQRLGWRYLLMALRAQLRFKEHVYAYGEETGLLESHHAGRRLSDFNLEQQGNIASDYYSRLSKGLDTSAWLPYIVDLQQDLA